MKEQFIRFLSPINPVSTEQLLQVLARLSVERYSRLHLLMATPGGSINHSLIIYHHLRGSTFETHTYNMANIDSAGILIYCGGVRRLANPFTRFMFHDLRLSMQGSFTRKEILASHAQLAADSDNYARVIAKAINKTPDEIAELMSMQTILNAEQARDYSLVHEIQDGLIPPDADVITINEVGDDHKSPEGLSKQCNWGAIG